MKKSIIYATMLTACGAMAIPASAQEVVGVTEVVEVVEVFDVPAVKPAPKWAIKGYDDLGLGKVMTITSNNPGQSSKSKYNVFGLTLGYTFWQRAHQSLEINLGVGYGSASARFGLDDVTYHYDAPAEADQDGLPYVRYCDVKNLSQKLGMNFVHIPLYLEYQYRPLKWLGIYAEVGARFAFRTSNTVGRNVRGTVNSWGIFPEYDDLPIEGPYGEYMDDFGVRNLSEVAAGKAKVKGFNPTLMCGVGFEFYTYEPVSFELGVRYEHSFVNSFSGKHTISTTGEYTAETAPVTYTVKDGTVVRSLADYTSKSRLNPLCIHMGVNVRF